MIVILACAASEHELRRAISSGIRGDFRLPVVFGAFLNNRARQLAHAQGCGPPLVLSSGTLGTVCLSIPALQQVCMQGALAAGNQFYRRAIAASGGHVPRALGFTSSEAMRPAEWLARTWTQGGGLHSNSAPGMPC
jgi:hypothetical protein